LLTFGTGFFAAGLGTGREILFAGACFLGCGLRRIFFAGACLVTGFFTGFMGFFDLAAFAAFFAVGLAFGALRFGGALFAGAFFMSDFLIFVSLFKSFMRVPTPLL
jgi:hypothetical protein